MPLYDYRCHKCGEVFEVRQKFADEVLTVHEACGGELERLISLPAIQFKGTGWYVTDYKGNGKSPAASPGKSSDSAGESKSEAKAESKNEAKSESKPESKTGEQTRSRTHRFQQLGCRRALSAHHAGLQTFLTDAFDPALQHVVGARCGAGL